MTLPKFINYNFYPLLAHHGVDLTNDYYLNAGVSRLHNFDGFKAEEIKSNETIFIKTDAIINLNSRWLEEIQKISNSFNLLTAVSALQVKKEIAELLVSLPNLQRWYCTNPPDIKSDKIVALPIGFEEKERAGGDQEILESFSQYKTPFTDKIDGVFLSYHTLSTNRERQNHHEYLSTQGYVSTQPCRLPFFECLTMMDRYRFNICFEGYGFDTHRYYESLLINSVPIMKRTVVAKMFERHNLPAVFVDDWRQIDDNFWSQIRKEKYDFSNVNNFLSTKYWKEIIEKARR